jgi:AraC family transcriptional regulator of adaptative response/methylated-DNA-[protein]-cysteine methyltransferase
LERVNCHLYGTEFQIKTWKSLLKIPYGQKVTYSQIAQDIGLPRSVRAVGNAISANPIAYLIPCHRVIRSSGELSGYAWGNSLKEQILDFESKNLGNITFNPTLTYHKKRVNNFHIP